MLKLKPSAKVSKRYLLIQGRKEDIERAILDYVGILGLAKATPVFVKPEKSKIFGAQKIHKKFSVKTGKNHILAVNRKELDKVRGAFAISADKIQVLRVSGTLKGLGKK